MVVPLGPAFANEQHADTFQQFHGSELALGQPDVGQVLLAAAVDRTGKEQRGSVRSNRFQLINELRTAEFGHHQIGEHQVDSAAFHRFDSTCRIGAGDDAVTARLQEHFADGERAFIIVDAENRPFWFHISQISF